MEIDLTYTALDPKRIGRITASNFYKLMTKPRSKGELFSASAQSYLNALVAQRLTGIAEESIDTAATHYGKAMESEAIKYYEDTYGVETEPVGFVEYGEDCGCTPDAKIAGYPAGVEVKCPYNSAVMVEYLQLRTQEELKENYPNHYWQVMFSLLVTGYDSWNWIAYDPRMIDDKNKMVTITIFPEDEDFDAMKEVLNKSINYLNSPLWK